MAHLYSKISAIPLKPIRGMWGSIMTYFRWPIQQKRFAALDQVYSALQQIQPSFSRLNLPNNKGYYVLVLFTVTHIASSAVSATPAQSDQMLN